jgi:DNA-binding SARP family transcriptional activator/tetratricopeptide (TPR) repeat protein
MTVASPRPPVRVLLVAGAGYGKTAAMEALLPASGVRCHARQALTADLSHGSFLGIDDVHELTPADQLTLVRRVAALPPHTGVVLTSRTVLDPAVRMRLRGPFVERGPGDLALSPQGVAALLREGYAVTDPALAERLHAETAGWPALVHLAADEACRPPRESPGSAIRSWVAAEVLAHLPRTVRQLLSILAELGPVDQVLLDRLARFLDLPEVPGAASTLVRTGVLVPRRASGGAEEHVVVPLVARGLTAEARPGLGATVLREVARGYADAGFSFAAARAAARTGDVEHVHALVEAHGEEMLGQGHAEGVVELLDACVGARRSVLVQRTYADALRVAGEPDAALRAFAPLVADAGPARCDRGLATRVALVHYTLGDPQSALDALQLAGDPDQSDVEDVNWLSCWVRTLAMLGQRARACALARRAVQAAERLGEPRALAAAHLAAARTVDGERKEAHHERARRAAEEAGDVVTAALVLVNQTHLRLASARYDEAARTGREAVRLVELGSPPGRRVAAMHNLAEALTRLGEFDEAQWHLERAIALARRLGPGRTAVGLLGLAEIHAARGHDDRARAAYAEAAELAREAQEVQVLVPVLAGVARHDARSAPEAARAAAEEARARATPPLAPYALTALARVALADGDGSRAADHAREAVRAARAVQADDMLAEALEVAGQCLVKPSLPSLGGCDVEAAAMLAEAAAIWRAGGAEPGLARTEVLLGRLGTADALTRARARDAVRRLRRLGVTHLDGEPLSVDSRAVTIGVLGGFTVSVDGAPVPLTAWRSRQARTLVKVLAARRGRPVTRDALCELLWPDDDPSRTGHRLSVLLATVRGVLDPDRSWPADRHILAEATGLRLDLRHVAVDADDLIHDAELAAALVDGGQEGRAAELLADLDARYAGDAFEDDPGQEWAEELREEARSAWAGSVRRLVSLRGRSGRAGDTHRLLVRLLAADPYDERTHRLLVRVFTRTGRHGEAQRAFERWSRAMQEIDAPLPDPAVLHLHPFPVPRSPLVLTSH